MIVGFTITDFKGHEKEAIEYILKVCILDSRDIAKNIVSAGPGINIFSKAVTIEDLKSQPFDCEPIETQDGKCIIASAVNFNLELSYNGVLRLSPTEYIHVPFKDVIQFLEYEKQGLVVILPEINVEGKNWILDGGSWDDNGTWMDSSLWRDSL